MNRIMLLVLSPMLFASSARAEAAWYGMREPIGANSRWRPLATLEEGESKLHHARDNERRADQDHDKNEREDNRNWHPRRGMARSLLHPRANPHHLPTEKSSSPSRSPAPWLAPLRAASRAFAWRDHAAPWRVDPRWQDADLPSLVPWPSGSSFRHDALGIGRAQFSRNAVLIGEPPTHL